MSTHLTFPLADFYDALVSNNLKEKLQPFIAQFRKKNIYLIYECVNRLIQIFQNKSQQPLMKFNALMATRFFFDTCEYAAITFIEIYMLPLIYEIALEKYLKRSQQGMELYFVDRGAQNTKQIRRLGLNYVQLAAEFIFNCAKVKPYRLIENRQLNEESNFRRTVKILNNKGIQQQQKCIYYIPSYPAQTRKKFLKKMKHLSPQPYISFVISQYLEQINLNKKCDLDIKKLLLFGDSFLTSTMVVIIQKELSNMSQNFINKKKYLNLLNDLVRSGQIESIYLVNSSEFIGQIAEQIMKVKGNLGYEQGQYIYPKIQASKQEKKQFYIDFLRMIEIWAYCMPSTDQGEDSDVLKVYEELKKRNFVFPKNVLLKKIKDEMDQNLQSNNQKNETLLRIADQDDRVSQRSNGSYISSKGQFKFHFPEYKEKNSYIEMDELHYKVFETKKRITRLTLDRNDLMENMKFIKNFVESWEDELQKLDIEDEDPHELQMLIDQGDMCGQQYQMIEPIFKLYEQKKITFEEFAQKVQLLENPQQNSFKSSSMKNSFQQYRQSQISLEHRLQNSKPSKFSHIRKQNIQNQNFGDHLKQEQMKKQIIENSPLFKKTSQKQSEISNEKFQSQSSDKSASKISQSQEFSENNSSGIQSSQKKSQSKKSLNHQKLSKLVKSKDSNSNYNIQVIKQSQKRSQASNSSKKFSKNQSEKHSTSKVSSFQEESPSSSQESQEKQSAQSPSKRAHFRTQREKQKSPSPFNEVKNYHVQTKLQASIKNIYYQKNEQKPTTARKSLIKHSVISKSSYHSQPNQAQMAQSGFNEGNSMMNDYQIENIPQQVYNQNGINLKKSSFKRTQSSAMRNSSHKRIQDSQHNLSKSNKKSSHHVSEAVSPFKKIKQSQPKDIKIKQSFIKDYQFIKGNKTSEQKGKKIKIDDNFTYEDAFRRKNGYEKSQNDSEISSESQSVIQRRNRKLKKQQVVKQIVVSKFNKQSEYYAEDTSILRQSNNKIKSPTKNLILFQSNHQSPLKLSKSANKFHQQYEIFDKSPKEKQFTDKQSEMSKNTSKFAGSKVKSSGIKLISKNDHKNFDNLYKDDVGNQIFGHDGLNREKSKDINYEQVTSEYNQVMSSSKSRFNRQSQQRVLEKQYFHIEERNEKSFNQSMVSMSQSQHTSIAVQMNQKNNRNLQIDQFKTKNVKFRTQNEETSQINEPENQPMLYSYYSDKSIHSKITDSHTRKGNNRSSNQNQFRNCFLNVDKDVLPLSGAKTKVVSSSFSSLDKAFNFIDCKVSNAKSSSKVHSVADAISEKNAKNSILLYKLEREKTRLVQNLQHKIKQLQVNGKMMKTKYALKDQSIRENFSSRQLSEPELKLNTNIVKTSRQSTDQNNSLHYQQSNKISSNHYDKEKQQEQKLSNLFINKKQNVIDFKQYEQFFEQYKKNSQKKTLHKKKGLFIKNQQIEIGYMISKKDKYLVVNVFITPYVSTLRNAKAEVTTDNNIVMKHKPAKIDTIETKKQEVIVASFVIQNIPFKLPLIKISFDQNRSYNINSYTFGLPCSLYSFVDIHQYSDLKDKEKSQRPIVRSDVFKCTKKLNKAQKLIQAFPIIKQTSKQKKVTELECLVKYQTNETLLSIFLNEAGHTVVLAMELSKQSNRKYLEYLVATMQAILEEEDR